MQFDVIGTIKLGKEQRKFTKTVDATTENAAKEKAYALLGSQNGAKRNSIKIQEVKRV